MKISKEEVLHVADLARLNIDESLIETFAKQLGSILEYMETLNQIDTAEIEPTSHAIDIANAFRDDLPHLHLGRKEALSNAPEAKNGSFIVPKVIE